MPTYSVPLGPSTTLLQNVVYALPAVKSTLFTDAAAPTLQASVNQSFTANVALTLTNGQVDLPGGGFIRSTGGAVAVTLSRA